MSKASREKRSLHPPRSHEVKKLHPKQADELSAYLSAKDVRPAPTERDLVAFLGRVDAAVYCAYERERIAGVAAGVLDQAIVRIAWLAVDNECRDLASILVERLEVFAQQSAAGMLFAQAAADSNQYLLLVELGFTPDCAEADVIAGRSVQIVDLLKLLDPRRRAMLSDET